MTSSRAGAGRIIELKDRLAGLHPKILIGRIEPLLRARVPIAYAHAGAVRGQPSPVTPSIFLTAHADLIAPALVRFESPRGRHDLPGMPRRHYDRRSISVRWILHVELVKLARARQISVCSLLDDILVLELERLGLTEGLGRSRRYAFKEPGSCLPRRRAVSVRGVVYERLLGAAFERNMRLTTLVDNLCVAEVVSSGQPFERVKTPPRVYRREGRPRAVKAAEDPWFGGYTEFGLSGDGPVARIVEPLAAPREMR